MILAAGLGTRLRPLTNHNAKPALPVLNVPLILYTLHLLRHSGIREVMVNLHFCPESIKKILGRGRKYKMKISYSFEPQILGTGGGLKKVQDFFQDEPFVLINGDIICQIDLPQAIAFHEENDATATMVLRTDQHQERYGVIGIDENDHIRRFTNIINPPGLDLRKYMFTGIHIFSPKVFEYIPPAVEICINAYAYPRMINNDEGVFGFVTDGFWSDLGTLESYWQTNLALMEQISPFSYFDPLSIYQYAPKREVDRIIRMGKNVNLKGNATLIDPVIIGDDCLIEEGAIVGPHVILGNDCIIEKNSRIEESIVFPGTKIPEGSLTQKQIRNKKITVEILKTNGKKVHKENGHVAKSESAS